MSPLYSLVRYLAAMRCLAVDSVSLTVNLPRCLAIVFTPELCVCGHHWCNLHGRVINEMNDTHEMAAEAVAEMHNWQY